MSKILITGASGLVGTRLSGLLASHGYEVNALSRDGKDKNHPYVDVFGWDVEKGQLDGKAFEGVKAIIHLAGANLADKRWTDKRKKEIIDSRVQSAKMIFEWLKTGSHEVATYISASAVGYYGDCGDKVLSEDQPAGNDFLAEVCKQWEDAAKQIASLGIRMMCCRNGVVLAGEGGALPELTKTLPLGFAGYFQKTNLYYSWIHIDDVCGIILHGIENKDVAGPYNTTAPHPLLIRQLMEEILKAKKSNALLAPVPVMALKLALGELSSMLLTSTRCSVDKIIAAGYTFKFPEIQMALRDIYPQKS